MEKALANTGSTVPAYMEKYKEDQIQIPKDEIQIPFLALAQGSSKAVKDGEVKYGEIYNSITKKSYGKEVVIAVVDQYIDWKMFSNSGSLVANSSNGIKWDMVDPIESGMNPEKTNSLTEEDKWRYKFYNFFCVLVHEDTPIPFLVSFARTSAKTGKKLLNLIAQGTNLRKLPPYVVPYKLTTKEAESGGNTFMTWEVTQVDGYVDEDTCKRASAMKKFVNSINVKNITPEHVN